MRNIVVVFARTPRLGTVKRRLAAGIGDRAAYRFYTATLTRLLRALARDRRFRTVVAHTPDHAAPRRPRGIAAVKQGRGDLGARMQRAFRRWPRARVVLVGSDIPDLGVAEIIAALRALGSARACFGPAADGGYYLVAFGPRRPATPFAGVRWSTEHALADTLANQRGRVALLRVLNDVDTAADLPGA